MAVFDTADVFQTAYFDEPYSVPSPSVSVADRERGPVLLYYSGRGFITATVAVKGSPNIPVSRRVRLHEQKSGYVVAETWSDTAGNYTFTCLDPAYLYYATAFDHTGAYQGVVADQLAPTVA